MRRVARAAFSPPGEVLIVGGGRWFSLLRLYLTRLALPVLLVAAMVAAPFVWLPDPAPPPPKTAAGGAPRAGERGASGRATPFQRAMTLGFALILVSVTAGGWMLYRITRSQTASWRRRFAPSKRRSR